MQTWNVVATTREGRFSLARDVLSEYGPVEKTGYFNVLVLNVEDIRHFLDETASRREADSDLREGVSRLVPVEVGFTFQTAEEFERAARHAALHWVQVLRGHSFHVRMHRRGFKGRLSSQDEERFLDEFLLGRLQEVGAPGRITFEDPDYVLVIETVGQRGGMSLWSREDLVRYPFLKVD